MAEIDPTIEVYKGGNIFQMESIIYYLFFTHVICYWSTVLFYTYRFNQWQEESWYVVKNVLVNQFVVTPLYWFLFLYYPESIASYHGLWQIPAMVILTDVIFYVCHRIFHWNKTLYSYVHEQHHRYDPPIACAGLYSHPLEHLCINLTSTVLPMFIVRANLTVALLWTIVTSINVVVAHSGIHGGAHTKHHKYQTCNYGVGVLLMDRVFNTFR